MAENKNVVVDLSKLMEYQKPYAESTLRNMRKDNLIQYIRELEYNRNVAISWNRQQAENVKDWEPVVRCKDCKHRDDGSCPMEAGYPWHDTEDNGFCSYGERRN